MFCHLWRIFLFGRSEELFQLVGCIIRLGVLLGLLVSGNLRDTGCLYNEGNERGGLFLLVRWLAVEQNWSGDAL